MIKFSQISDKLNYPPQVKGALSTLHSDIVTYVCDNFNGSQRQRSTIVRLLNSISYYQLSKSKIPDTWDSSDPLTNVDDILVDDTLCRQQLRDLYILDSSVIWDIEIQISDDLSVLNIDSNPVADDIQSAADSLPEYSEELEEPQIIESTNKSTKNLEKSTKNSTNSLQNVDTVVMQPTPKEDLYIQPPKVPRFDVTMPWKQRIVNNTQYVIYPSEPKIPTAQNEISVTTDVDLMTTADLLGLYPNQFIPTRAACMYTPIDGITYHEKLGLILPIDGYTEEQLIDNIVKYPHFFRLTQEIDDQIVSFYTTIEISGELYKVRDYWDQLPESKVLPYQSDFIKEYVVRRYLLERDVKHIQHKYPLFGSLDPFLTLFTTPEDYRSLGYTDIEGIAKSCVQSRVSYKQTRNPILRRINNA